MSETVFLPEIPRGRDWTSHPIASGGNWEEEGDLLWVLEHWKKQKLPLYQVTPLPKHRLLSRVWKQVTELEALSPSTCNST